MPILTQGSVEMFFDGKPIPQITDATLTFTPSRPEVPADVVFPISGRGSYSATASFTIPRGSWERFMSMFEPSKPKWGQPGRRRRQKARLAARRHNEWMQRQQAECLRLFQRMKDRQRDQMREFEERRARSL